MLYCSIKLFHAMFVPCVAATPPVPQPFICSIGTCAAVAFIQDSRYACATCMLGIVPPLIARHRLFNWGACVLDALPLAQTMPIYRAAVMRVHEGCMCAWRGWGVGGGRAPAHWGRQAGGMHTGHVSICVCAYLDRSCKKASAVVIKYILAWWQAHLQPTHSTTGCNK